MQPNNPNPSASQSQPVNRPSGARPLPTWQQQMNQQQAHSPLGHSTPGNSSHGGVSTASGPQSIGSTSSSLGATSGSSACSAANPGAFAPWRHNLAAGSTQQVDNAHSSINSSGLTSGPSSVRTMTTSSSLASTSSSGAGVVAAAGAGGGADQPKPTGPTPTRSHLLNSSSSSASGSLCSTNTRSAADHDHHPTAGAGQPNANVNLNANANNNDTSGAELTEQETRKLRLQIYVFVLRCISYPFNAKQSDLSQQRHQQSKLRLTQLEEIIALHSRYLRSVRHQSSGTNASQAADYTSSPNEARELESLHEQAHEMFHRKFLQTQRMRLLVSSQCCSQADLRDLFKICCEKQLAASSSSHLFKGSTRDYNTGASVRAGDSSAATPSSSSGARAGQRATSARPSREQLISSWLIRFEQILRGSPDANESSATLDSPKPNSKPNSKHHSNSTQTSSQHAEKPLTKEQLYQMFQSILSIKKFEHQLLYNALQLDSSDEQAAAIRRELDGRIARITEIERQPKSLAPKFVLKDMDQLYFEELRYAVNRLMINLDNLPVTQHQQQQIASAAGTNTKGGVASALLLGAGGAGGAADGAGGSGGAGHSLAHSSSASSRVSYGLQKFRRYNSRAQTSLAKDALGEGSHPSEPSVTKLDVVLSFHIEVIVMEARGLACTKLAPNREIYCTMEIEGSERLQTEHVPAKKPLWDTQGDFTTNHPLPVLKIKLYAVNQSVLSLEDKELAKLVLRPTVLSSKSSEWWPMQLSSGSSSSSSNYHSQSIMNQATSASGSGSASGCDSGGGPNASLMMGENQANMNDDEQLKLRVTVRMDRPQQLKHCGHLLGVGKSTWHSLKRRYHILIQVSQYTFVLCSYKDKKAKPQEMLQLEGYTVDFIEPPTDLIMEHCAQLATSEHHSHSRDHHAHSTLGLAGRLANVILKQPSQNNISSNSSLQTNNSFNASSSQLQDSSSGGGPLADGGCGPGSTGLDHQHHHHHQENHHTNTPNPPSAIQTAAALSDDLHNKFYFNLVKEGDSLVFACDDEQECFGWVMALYRATGQAHKPTPIREQYAERQSSSQLGSGHYLDNAFAYQNSAYQPAKLIGSGSHSVGAGHSALSMGGHKGGPTSSLELANQRARKHGMDEFILADPKTFQHNYLFKFLQNETLKFRLEDAFCCLGWFSPGQIFVLDEYCARYGVRTSYRHLTYLDSLLEQNARHGYFIDHTLLNYGYDFCSCQVSGRANQAHPIGSVNLDLRPNQVATVTIEERDMFFAIKNKLLKMIERQISNFNTSFPFGKPDGALRAALSLLERLLVNQDPSPNSMLQNEEVRSLIRRCLEQAALNSYTDISGQANLSAPPPPNSISGSLAQAHGAAAITLDHSTSQATPSGPLSLIGSGSTSSAAQHQSLGSSSTTNNKQNQNINNPAPRSLDSGHSVDATPPNTDNRMPSCVTMAMIIQNDQIKAKEKLRYLIRLAEICCDHIEEENDYFSDAFAWHGDLMMEHFELFWSLFGVDMEKILNELGFGHQNSINNNSPQQMTSMGGDNSSNNNNSNNNNNNNNSVVLSPIGAVGTHRELFALFQVLNNHLGRPNQLECKKFKKYLCDMFKPKLINHIDIMESSLGRMLAKACERDSSVNEKIFEQMFLRIEDLQRFVLQQLRWPEEQLAEQLHQRLKLIAYELCEASLARVSSAFQKLECRSSKWSSATTNYTSPTEMIQMIDLVLDIRHRSQTLCTFNNFDQMSYHSKVDTAAESVLGGMQSGLMSKMLYALEGTLTKLARYDEGNLLAPILSLTNKQGMTQSGRDIGKQYASYVFSCCDLLRHKINDELWIVNLLEEWYAAQMNIICTWLGERIDRSLHNVQLDALMNIVPKIYNDMSLQGVSEDRLSLKSYQTIMNRLKMEEACSSVAGSSVTGVGSAQGSGVSGGNSSVNSASGSSNYASGQANEQIGTGSCGPGTGSIFSSSILSSLGSQARDSGSGAGSSSGGGSGSNHQTPMTTGSSRFETQLSLSSSSNLRSQSANSQATSRRLIYGTAGSEQTGASSGSPTGAANFELSEQSPDNNLADRALQSATRMFKGFWAGN